MHILKNKTRIEIFLMPNECFYILTKLKNSLIIIKQQYHLLFLWQLDLNFNLFKHYSVE